MTEKLPLDAYPAIAVRSAKEFFHAGKVGYFAPAEGSPTTPSLSEQGSPLIGWARYGSTPTRGSWPWRSRRRWSSRGWTRILLPAGDLPVVLSKIWEWFPTSSRPFSGFPARSGPSWSQVVPSRWKRNGSTCRCCRISCPWRCRTRYTSIRAGTGSGWISSPAWRTGSISSNGSKARSDARRTIGRPWRFSCSTSTSSRRSTTRTAIMPATSSSGGWPKSSGRTPADTTSWVATAATNSWC